MSNVLDALLKLDTATLRETLIREIDNVRSDEILLPEKDFLVKNAPFELPADRFYTSPTTANGAIVKKSPVLVLPYNRIRLRRLVPGPNTNLKLEDKLAKLRTIFVYLVVLNHEPAKACAIYIELPEGASVSAARGAQSSSDKNKLVIDEVVPEAPDITSSATATSRRPRLARVRMSLSSLIRIRDDIKVSRPT